MQKIENPLHFFILFFIFSIVIFVSFLSLYLLNIKEIQTTAPAEKNTLLVLQNSFAFVLAAFLFSLVILCYLSVSKNSKKINFYIFLVLFNVFSVIFFVFFLILTILIIYDQEQNKGTSMSVSNIVFMTILFLSFFIHIIFSGWSIHGNKNNFNN
jgi:hypothetical protein